MSKMLQKFSNGKPSVSERPKSVEFMVTIVSSPWQWTSDELRQNFISDEMQLHTSTRSELNLIKSVICIYIYNLSMFYILTIFY